MLVGFEHGHLDRPYVLAGLYNGQDRPGVEAGAQLPVRPVHQVLPVPLVLPVLPVLPVLLAAREAQEVREAVANSSIPPPVR